jgi:hypothetical protein
LGALETSKAAIAEAIAAINFDDMQELLSVGQTLLRQLAAPENLAALFDHTQKNPPLLSKCEHFNLFDKIVLHDDPQRNVRLRLHVFGGEVKEVHHHRASFASLVLHGSYRHLLFGDEKYLGNPAEASSDFQPLLAQDQRPGSAYALHHAMVHATFAKPETVSLMFQAPIARGSFRIYDLETGRRRDRVGKGQAVEAQEDGESIITLERMLEIGDCLRRWELI